MARGRAALAEALRKGSAARLLLQLLGRVELPKGDIVSARG
jgi:hypothetical protein